MSCGRFASWIGAIASLLLTAVTLAAAQAAEQPARPAAATAQPGKQPAAAPAAQAGPLAGWKTEAADAEIDTNLPDWIEEAMVHLDHHCSRVAPEKWESADDPTPSSRASLICEKPASLAASSLEHGNAVWSGRLNEEVLAPLRQEMNGKKETLKGVQAELKTLTPSPSPKGRGGNDALPPRPSPVDCRAVERRGELKEEEQRLKREIKRVKEKIDAVSATADRLRKRIAAWQCRDAGGWEPWLAEEPMYDAISSTDGRRGPPATVAEWIAQERSYIPDINDGVRVNIAPLQKAGVLAADVLAKKDVDKAIADRAEWRAGRAPLVPRRQAAAARLVA